MNRNLILAFIIIGTQISCKQSSPNKTILTHWLQGSFQASSNEGEISEEWAHPEKQIWVANRKIRKDNQLIEESKIEIKSIDGELSLILNWEGNEYILPSKIVDMREFEFANESDNGPQRVKFERIDDNSYRRVHYTLINGRNTIDMYDFKKTN